MNDTNTGYRNTGYWNDGDRNAGDRNTGNFNTGYINTGNFNTGYRNTGYWNTGDRNTGDRNTGNFNTGYRNTGNWNTGNFNTGYFNIDEPKLRIFGKETNIKKEDLIFPSFLNFNLTDWINESDMEVEQKNNSEYEYYKTTLGILVKYDYKEAFKKSYESLSEEERQKQTNLLKNLPNFDSEIFKEISGIDIDSYKIKLVECKINTEEIIELNGKKYKLID